MVLVQATLANTGRRKIINIKLLVAHRQGTNKNAEVGQTEKTRNSTRKLLVDPVLYASQAKELSRRLCADRPGWLGTLIAHLLVGCGPEVSGEPSPILQGLNSF